MVQTVNVSCQDLSDSPKNLNQTLKFKMKIILSFNKIAQNLLNLNYENGDAFIKSLCEETANENCYASEIENAILKSVDIPIQVHETEEITALGQRGIYVNKCEVDNWKGPLPISEYEINADPKPIKIKKKPTQKLEYVQETTVKYLRPPTPPPPGDIIIKQEPNYSIPPAPPLIIRQQPPKPPTPEPLVIREAPPTPPPLIGRKFISISGRTLPPPPRKVIVERLAPLPCKPQSVLIERWMAFPEQKRKVVYQPAPPDPVVLKPRNVIVQWDPPSVEVKKEYKYLGIVEANPIEYIKKYGGSLKSLDDLPDYLSELKTSDQCAPDAMAIGNKK